MAETSYHKLERRLVLLAWLNRHFGFEDNEDFLKPIFYSFKIADVDSQRIAKSR